MKPELLKKYSSSFADAYSIGCLEINYIFSSGAVEMRKSSLEILLLRTFRISIQSY